MVQLDSTAIETARYDRGARTLLLRFRHGGTYEYAEVPDTVYDGLLAADSAGHYFHEHILGRYAFRRLS